MKAVALSAFPRSLARRGGVKKLRATGRIPAIIYGRHTQPQNLELKLKEVEDLLHSSASETILVDLAVSGDTEAKRLALLQEVQHHPLSGQVLHVDLHQVAENEKVTVAIPVEAIGEAAGVKTGGGVLEHVLFKIRLRGLPKDLPECIEVDVSKLEIGQAVHLGEIPLPAGVEAIGDKSIPVISVAAPITEAQEAAVLEGASAPLTEAEMLKERKEEGEGEAPAAGVAKPGEKGVAKPADKAGATAPAAPAAGAAKPGEKGVAKPADKGAAKPAEKGAEKKK